MRITGGRSKGRLLSTVRGSSIRPTSSKVREAIFDIIGQDLSGLHVLDLFAGTGCLGLEALSRGADRALFVDYSDKSLAIIRRNLTLCGFRDRGEVIKKNIAAGLPAHKKLSEHKVDLVFIDPPYGKDLIPGVMKSLLETEIMASDSIIVAESMKNDSTPGKLNEFNLIKSRTYGETKIDIYYKEL